MKEQEVMSRYLLAFIHGLRQAGVTQAVISPGSRSTPLALLLYRDPTIQTHILVDERSAGFFAVGLAKSSGEAIALVCTSGTAAANYYPAICEAKASNLPLVVLTTDRPPELRNVGAPQAMDQQNLYGNQVKQFSELNVPEAGDNLLRYSYWQGFTNSLVAQEVPKGPVQINLPLREPLLPVEVELDVNQFSTEVFKKTSVNFELTGTSFEKLFEKKGLIVVGGSQSIETAQKLLALAEKLQWPIVGDPLTSLGNCGKISRQYLKHAELVFDQLEATFVPEVVLRFGTLPVTKNVMLYLKNLAAEDISWLFIDESHEKKDQLQLTNLLIAATAGEFCDAVLKLSLQTVNEAWSEAFYQREKLAVKAQQQTFLNAAFSESHAARELSNQLEQGEQLLVANSNAIRYFDRFSQVSEKKYTVYGNRGVNGIDGLVSTTAGLATNSKQTYLLIGDLALFHDMNGLQAMRQLKQSVTIILLNNNGGGIFSHLSQNQLPPTEFDALFGTPLNLDFKKAAALYEAGYQAVATATEFKAALQKGRQRGLQLIEVQGQQAEGYQLWQKVLKTYHEMVAANEKDN
ncbi:2-succinyl-5-enolpyruvyl-6-hydroxy-3-cyclohexene-1-carboxylic-acid synthase [Enterococcus sp. LJL90]